MWKTFWDGFFGEYENFTVRALIGLCTLIIIVNAIYQVYSTYGTKTVTVDSKHFECTDTEPYGIEARCTQLTWIKGAR